MSWQHFIVWFLCNRRWECMVIWWLRTKPGTSLCYCGQIININHISLQMHGEVVKVKWCSGNESAMSKVIAACFETNTDDAESKNSDYLFSVILCWLFATDDCYILNHNNELLYWTVYTEQLHWTVKLNCHTWLLYWTVILNGYTGLSAYITLYYFALL